MKKIPVFEPQIGEEEIAAVVAALRRGELSGTFGESIPKFEANFASFCQAKHGVAVTSGTTALHLAASVAGIQAGDEVLVSASTNIASALAVHHLGGRVVPVDSETRTWNLNLDLLESLMTPRTKAIIVVHLFGHPVDMDRVMEFAQRHQLIVIEDAAEAHGAEVRGRKVGSFGHLACFSFYGNKHITTGEGGMVLTQSDALMEKLRLRRNLSFTLPRFWHPDAGFQFRMTGYQAAMGVVQCGRLPEIIQGKRRLAAEYTRRLSDLPQLQLPVEEPWARHVYWMYGVRVRPESGRTRDQLATYLHERGIDTRDYFCPMNQQPCLYSEPGWEPISCPVAEDLWQTGLYLPSTPTLSEADLAYIAEAIHHFFN